MTTVTVIGAEGFVGSAFVRHLSTIAGVELRTVTRHDYAHKRGPSSDVTIDCAGNSRKYLADERPIEDFDLSVAHRLRTLHDFPARRHLHVSSVDVYSDLTSPDTTREETPIDATRTSRYGFHKWLAEELVRHYCSGCLIVRLAGMVGPGLRKNPVHDVLHGKPLRIHPDSQYQFLHTTAVATMAWSLIEHGGEHEVVNICGEGLISPREIARMAGVKVDLSLLAADAAPRIVNVDTRRLKADMKGELPSTRRTIEEFVGEWRRASAPA